jgi:GrpB-like predicted nucleotidyltransferase (UPF0157 family)
MSSPESAPPGIILSQYDPVWPERYVDESRRVFAAADPPFGMIEHIGSTSIPGLQAKPVIDMMATTADIERMALRLAPFEALGYCLIETGMHRRLMLRRYDLQLGLSYHLHIVEESAWDESNERLLRDHLRAHPEEAAAYGQLKEQLAAVHAGASEAYTRAKTAFIQTIVDRARDERGLPRVNVWED